MSGSDEQIGRDRGRQRRQSADRELDAAGRQQACRGWMRHRGGGKRAECEQDDREADERQGRERQLPDRRRQLGAGQEAVWKRRRGRLSRFRPPSGRLLRPFGRRGRVADRVGRLSRLRPGTGPDGALRCPAARRDDGRGGACARRVRRGRGRLRWRWRWPGGRRRWRRCRRRGRRGRGRRRRDREGHGRHGHGHRQCRHRDRRQADPGAADRGAGPEAAEPADEKDEPARASHTEITAKRPFRFRSPRTGGRSAA